MPALVFVVVAVMSVCECSTRVMCQCVYCKKLVMCLMFNNVVYHRCYIIVNCKDVADCTPRVTLVSLHAATTLMLCAPLLRLANSSQCIISLLHNQSRDRTNFQKFQ